MIQAMIFDFVASRDDVEQGKPDPEIYLLVAQELAIAPEACLVIEDSPSGVETALAAGMHCLAVTTPFTKEAIHTLNLLPASPIVDEPDQLTSAAAQIIEQHNE
jgi:beta-phosphoglucomutase-like phosphatase (HAD superfamily)